ncbi:hypothetical protein HY025_00265 [Candidatus Daviesbacteria bacterium]|nr:hypothetical protein [Candidatus Daviesbacteria bacterium]
MLNIESKNGYEGAKNSVRRFTHPLGQALRTEVVIRAGSVLALLASLPAVQAFADGPAFPAWNPTLPGVPSCEGADISKAGFTSLFVKSPADKIAVVEGGPMSYQDPTGQSFSFEGRSKGADRGSAVIVYGGTPNNENTDPCIRGGIELKVWEDKDKKVGGNWEGLTPYPADSTSYDNGVEQKLVADINRSMTDPAIGNNVKDTDISLIDGRTGNIVWIGSVRNEVLTHNFERPTPDFHFGSSQAQQTAITEPVAQPAVAANACGTSLGNKEMCVTQDLTVVDGDTKVTNATGQFVQDYDDKTKTGAVSIVPAGRTIFAEWGAGIIHANGQDPEVIAEQIKAQQKQSGCGLVSGCSDGTIEYHP